MKHLTRLDDNHRIFIKEYLVDLNGTRAYMSAYNVTDRHSASVGASRLLRDPLVSESVRLEMAKRINRLNLSQDMVVWELMNIATTNVTDVVTVRDGRISVKNLDELPEYVQLQIKSIKPTKSGQVEIEFYDKVKALEMLGKHLGMFRDRVELETPGVRIINDIPKPDDE